MTEKEFFELLDRWEKHKTAATIQEFNEKHPQVIVTESEYLELIKLGKDDPNTIKAILRSNGLC